MGDKNAAPKPPRKERWRLDRLKANPLQAGFYRDLSAFDLKALAKSILLRGLKQPIEVLPDGTILDGHQRLAALRLNGATHADVLVRDDLAAAGTAAKEAAFLEANVLRRQLSPFVKARALLGLLKAEKGKPQAAKLSRPEWDEVRDRLGHATGLGERNLNRYVLVLKSAPEVQKAFEDGHLTLVQAARVGALLVLDGGAKRHEAFAARLRAGERPRAVYAAYFPPTGRGHVSASNAVAAFARSLEAVGQNLAGRLADVKAGVVRQHKEPLRAGGQLIKELLGKLGRAG